MIRSLFIVIIFSFVLGANTSAQKPDREALRLFQSGYFAESIPFFESALARDTSLLLLESLAYAHYKIKNYEPAQYFFSKAFSIPYYSETTPYYLADINKILGNYDDAISFYELCNYYPSSDQELLALKISSCKLAKQSLSRRLNLEVINAASLNSAQSDCVGQLIDQVMYLSSDRKSSKNSTKDPVSGSYCFRIFSANVEYSNQSVPKFSRVKRSDGNLLEENYHIAFPFYFNDHKNVAYEVVPSINRQSFAINSTINIASSKNGKYFTVNIEQALPYQADYSNVQPCVIESDNLIIFSSNRPGGFGGFDLYQIDLSAGVSAQAINLGKEINSSGDELFPTFSEGCLYFSSNGKNAIGGLDIYRAVILPNKKFEKAVWLPAPINSSFDEFSFQIAASGSTAFFSSDRPGGKGKDDIYYISLPDQSFKTLLSTLK